MAVSCSVEFASVPAIDDTQLRVLSIFVIFCGSFLGAWLPIATRVWRSSNNNGSSPRSSTSSSPSSWALASAKHFGSGIIIATAFIHLLAPATETLKSPCLDDILFEYYWADAICMLSIFLLFVVEFLITRSSRRIRVRNSRLHGYTTIHEQQQGYHESEEQRTQERYTDDPAPDRSVQTEDEFHSDQNDDQPDSINKVNNPVQSPIAELTSVYIFEFGVVFHSIFIGLTLAVARENFPTLFLVLTLHQTFEGIALGSKLATIAHTQSSTYHASGSHSSTTAVLMALLYALSTPLAIAAGLLWRAKLDMNSPTALVLMGVFDAISAGILMHTGLVELVARDFVLNESMLDAPLSESLTAIAWMGLGVSVMAVLGKWV